MSGATLDYLTRLGAWALVLFVAQGLLLTASWLLWSRLLRRAPAALRHQVAVGHFAGFTLLPLLSLAVLHWTLAQAGAEPSAFAATRFQPAIDGSVAARLVPLAAVLWLAGAAVAAAGLMRALTAPSPERQPATPALTAAVARLSRLLGLTRIPSVAIADVTSPQVVGWLEPAILLPADITQRLTPAELDAVLLHELAHIRHGDYGWNLLQRALLVVTWFHPGAWYVHACLRRERELRCDEAAARRCRSGADLAMALVRLAEPHATPALALPVAGGDLTTRVARLVEPPPAERPWLAALPITAAVLLCAFAAQAGAAGRHDTGLRDRYLASAFSPARLVQAHDDAGVFQVRILGGRVVAASVGPTAVPASVVQHGQAVTLLDQHGRPAVAVTVTPDGRMRWQSRPPPPAA